MHLVNEVFIRELSATKEGSNQVDWSKSETLERVVTEGIAKELGIDLTETEVTKGYNYRYDSAIKATRFEIKAVSSWNTLTSELKYFDTSPGGLDYSESTYHIFLTPGRWNGTLLLKLQAIETGLLRKYIRSKPELISISKKSNVDLLEINIFNTFKDHVLFIGYFNIINPSPVSFDLNSLTVLNRVRDLKIFS
jgi:hypothetical protein